MEDYIENFDLRAYAELDNYALLSCQKYNYGNDTDWFGSFRGGLNGSYGRIHGVVNHYYAVHSWMPRQRFPSETEHHIASLFFNMDSAIECITFALNALGFCASNYESFLDVRDTNKLKKISPYNIIGRKPLPEYEEYFPKVKGFWESKLDLINIIIEQHDVSKHRESIFVGGECRNDPPPGFFESLGIQKGDSTREVLFWPMKEVIVKHNPKAPRAVRTTSPPDERILLENLVPEYREFIEATGKLALQDAKENINLKVQDFKKPNNAN